MYNIRPTTKFQKDLKRVKKRGFDISLLTDISELLGNKLPSFLLQPPLLSNTKCITKSYTMSTSVRLG